MEKTCNDFWNYLTDGMRLSNNTVVAYMRDIRQFSAFLLSHGIRRFQNIDDKTVIDYFYFLQDSNMASSTVSRKISSIKKLYQFLDLADKLHFDIGSELLPKQKKKLPSAISIKDIRTLLNAPDQKDPKGQRDKAMLELLYATGIRVSELIMLNVRDIDLGSTTVYLENTKSKRTVPFGKMAKKYVADYLKSGRKRLLDGRQDKGVLFLNLSGKRMSR